MDKAKRAIYAEKVASACRQAITETGIKSFPDDMIWIVKSWDELADLDDLLGSKVFVSDMRSSHDIFPAFRADDIKHRGLLKAFTDAMEMSEDG